MTGRPTNYDYLAELRERFGSTHMIRLESFGVSSGERRPYMVAERVAIINISGVLVQESEWWDETEYSAIRDEVGQALADAEVDKILLRINSPGGDTNGAFETAAFLAEVGKKKPMWAVADTMAYSAGYLLASQASRIFVPPVTGGVGSIGVYALHMDYSGMLNQMGVKPTFISAGKGKTEGNRFEPLGKEAKASLQAEIDRLYGEFVMAVSRGRRMPEEECRALGAYCYQGAKAAISAGLADAAGTADEAWVALASMGSQSNNKFSAQAEKVQAAPAVSQIREEEVPMSTQEAAGAGSSGAKQYTQAEVDQMIAEATAKARNEGASAVSAEVLEVQSLCQMARRPDMASKFVKERTPVAQVREELARLAVAEDSAEISGHLKSPAESGGNNGPITGAMVIAAVESLVAQGGR